jgi:signal transduction histidine kinase
MPDEGSAPSRDHPPSGWTKTERSPGSDIHPSLLAAALQHSGPMYIADSGGRLLMTNAAFDEIIAASSRDFSATDPGTPSGALRKILDRLAEGEHEVVTAETAGTNGTRRHYRSIHRRIEGANGATAVIGHYFEVSIDGDESEFDFERRALDSHAAVAAKNAFLGKMSHEMRTPLNAIIGFAEMSESQPFGPIDQRYVDYLQNIGNAARHLSGMIGDLLELANGHGDPGMREAGSVALGPILDDARNAVADLAARRGIDLEAVRSAEDWTVAADRDRTLRICVNLLDNAVKYTEPGGRVGVDIRVGDDLGMLDIQLWDTGIGIAADRLDRIFESFHRIDPNALHQPTNGAGLGLAVSRHLARQMNGDIHVESALGQGTRFTLRLPAAK